MQKYLVKLTLKQLIHSGVHIGYLKFSLNRKLKSYILGYYNHFYLINLYYTNLQLKLLVNIIVKLISSNQQIFFIQSNNFFLLKKTLKQKTRKSFFIYDANWIHGFLTNFKLLRQHYFEKYVLNPKKTSNLPVFTNSRYLSYYTIKFFPSLILFFDDYTPEALKEASHLGIPTGGIIDTQFKYIKYLNYPILGNNKSYNSLLLYYTVFLNAVLKGLQHENFKILALS